MNSTSFATIILNGSVLTISGGILYLDGVRIGLSTDTGYISPAGAGNKAFSLPIYNNGTDFSGGDTVDISKISIMETQVALLTNKLQAIESTLLAGKIPSV